MAIPRIKFNSIPRGIGLRCKWVASMAVVYILILIPFDPSK
jgi:hypothetical protein